MNATNPTNAAVAPATILAFDLGKYKSVACLYDRATAQAQFHTLDTTRDELRRLFDRHRPALVVFEACTLAGWVHDLCAELGLACQVANTASEAWKFKHIKRKTDKDDARRLAQREALGQLPTVVVPSKPTRQWRALISYRQVLVGRRVTIQNHLRAHRGEWLVFLDDPEVPPTNHHAEQMLRPAVITRTVGGCNKTLWGALVHGILSSIMVTCKRQGQRFLDLARRLWQSSDSPASPLEALPGG
jgi:hypothetical protein